MTSAAPRADASWRIETDAAGDLLLAGTRAADLADRFGTPLHVVDVDGLRENARAFTSAFARRYQGLVEPFFAVKCNSVGGVLHALKHEGFGAEVFTLYELRLAQAAGYMGHGIIVNGPGKTDEFLSACVDAGVRLIVLDRAAEADQLSRIARDRHAHVDVLVRVNVDYVPAGMNPGTATGSRKSVFGIDAEGDELVDVVRRCREGRRLHFRGLHMHIGSGILRAVDYARACARLCAAAARVARTVDVPIEILDVGGGYGTPMVREFSTIEFLLYHGLEHLSPGPTGHGVASFDDFAEAVCGAIATGCATHNLPLPALWLEPGRCLTSPHQTLLIRVLAIKQRSRQRPHVITDGGQMTVNFPTFYEHHAMVCCRNPHRPPARRVDVVGPGCHSADFVCRNRALPEVVEGDLLAIMDAGAYFLSFEGNFGFPRAAVVGIEHGLPSVLRRRETCDDMLSRESVAAELVR
jgi:diaminopimelate decarboxylase